MLPRESVESASSETPKSNLDTILDNQLSVALLEQGRLDKLTSRCLPI